MQVAIGSFTFDASAVGWTESFVTERNQGGQPVRTRKTVSLSGKIYGASQSALTTTCLSLDTACATPYLDVILYDNSGAVARRLPNSGSISGVVCDSWGYPDGKGADYTTYRNFVAQFSATYGITEAESFLLSFTETLAFSGGGPLYTHVQTVEGPPEKQKLVNQTPYRCTQTGSASGRTGYPPIPNPLFPDALVQAGSPSYTAPQRRGTTLEGYGVSWSYQFESAQPLVGLPTAWNF